MSDEKYLAGLKILVGKDIDRFVKLVANGEISLSDGPTPEIYDELVKLAEAEKNQTAVQ